MEVDDYGGQGVIKGQVERWEEEEEEIEEGKKEDPPDAPK